MNLILFHDELRQIVEALPRYSRLYLRLQKLVEPGRICECGASFFPRRRGQIFCSRHCSQIFRQREYWIRRGKKVRQRRLRANR